MIFALYAACTPAPDDSKPETTEETGDPEDSGDTGETGAADAVTGLTVTVHPEIGALLVARWEQTVAGEVWIAFGVDGETPQATPVTTRAVGPQEQILIGVPYDMEVAVTLHAEDTETETATAHTDPLPETVPVPELRTSVDGAFDDDWLLIGMSSGGEGWASESFWKMILDRKGRVVWAMETPDQYRTFYMQPSVDGTHIVWDECTFWTDFDLGEGSTAHRMTLDGTVSETFPLPGLHHAFRDLGDGNVAWGGYEGEREILRERAADGTVREIWDCSAYWRSQGATMPCDGNALYHDATTDSFLYSSDNMNSVAQVDRATGEVLRTFGQLSGSMPFAEGTDPFWKQHGVHFTAAGTLLLSAWTDSADHQVIAREFEVDETEGVLREIWRCGEGTGTEGEYAGEAHRLTNGNTLLNYGEGGVLREYTPECTEVWQLAWPYANLLGRAVFLDDLYALMP